ncbi:alkaline phosphatase D family protein [Verrucomicrobiales bacterium]|nr:alkaline phosphatase D family protein [Verrucomicrobiales bacterium]
MKPRSLFLAVITILLLPLGASADEGAHFANGLKIGEVTPNSAIIWTRLTKHPERNIEGTPFPKNKDKKRRSLSYDDLDSMEGAVPGIAGEVRLVYREAAKQGDEVKGQWFGVDGDANFTRQFKIEGLKAGTSYEVTFEARSASGEKTASVKGGFATAPADGVAAPVSFSVVTGQDYPRRDDKANGHQIYPKMKELGVDFFVHTGDIEYYDKAAPFADNIELARFKWNRLYSMPFQRDFHNHTASYFMKDDHDTLKNDAWPGQHYGDLTWEDGLKLFPEQVPMGKKTYRTIRWGKDLQIWLVEGRDFRSPNNMSDGPNKTIWGEEQKQWFFETVKASDATFRVLISPTPVVGPDRGNKNDNHANKGFTHEGDELRAFIASQRNMFVACGDRHWQYVSVDPKTGLREYSCGPTADEHASGFKEENRSAMHRYLNIKGGFLRVEVCRESGEPKIAFRHHGVTGELYNEDVQIADR